jgi:lipoate---protein ligase
MHINILHLHKFPIFEQLRIEEAILRTNTQNWCVINEGSSPAIVMGISGKPEQLIDLAKVAETPIPIIKRFSGGGTVVVDEQTFFVTFIFQRETHPFAPYPEPIMKWSENLYKKAFQNDLFHLKENDFVIGQKKCGGNAQYLKKDRWLLHTSFLWDYNPLFMDYLLHPKKTPSYRLDRSHVDFLCCLKDHEKSKENIIENLKKQLKELYVVEEKELKDVLSMQEQIHRQATVYLELQSLSGSTRIIL